MTDQGAIESIAKALRANYNDFIEADDPITLAPRILDALAADGYSVVKAEWEYGYRLIGSSQIVPVPKTTALHVRDGRAERGLHDTTVFRHAHGPWEPVPEGSEDEQ